jgi:hypothetical protein
MPGFDAHNFAKQITEVAERVADVSDAVRGKRKGSGGLARWLILPAAGAAVYAAAKNRAPVAGPTRGGAEARAGEMPEMDLLNRVKAATGFGAGPQEETRRSRAASPRIKSRQLEEHRRERAERRSEYAT